MGFYWGSAAAMQVVPLELVLHMLGLQQLTVCLLQQMKNWLKLTLIFSFAVKGGGGGGGASGHGCMTMQ